MKHCNNCDVDINTNEKVCPLCQSRLIGKNKSVYPTLKSSRNDLVLKILSFISFVSIFITGYLDYVVNNKFTFSIFVALGVITTYILLRYILKSVHKDFFNLFYNSLFIIMVLLFVWYGFTKLSIIPSILIPSITIFDLVLSSILAITLREKYIRKYIHVIFMNVVFSLIPVILVLTHIADDLVLAHISFIFAVVSVLGLIVFDVSSLKEEIYKMFYI